MKFTFISQDESGTVMILLSVMLLALLTIISFTASRTASTELKIASNEYFYQRCFYNAEGAIMETVDFLETTEIPAADAQKWIGSDGNAINDSTVFAYWEDAAETQDATPEDSTINFTDTSYLAVHHGIIAGNSLDMSKSSINTISIYGRCKNKGLVMLKVGYAKVYK
jgi:Tfp pilus assembly protein PilX